MTAFVLLPGMDGTGKLFDAFVAALGADHQITVVSYPSDASLGYGELEAVARAALPVDRRYVLLAESFSGPIGISIAASKPLGLAGLVLCCTFARLPFPYARWMRHLARAAPAWRVPETLVEWMLLGRHVTAELRRDVAAVLDQAPPAVLRRRLAESLAIDARPLLASIQVPTLYLRATDDRLIRRAASLGIAAALPQPQIQDLDAPHLLLQVQPRAAAEAVLAFASPLTD